MAIRDLAVLLPCHSLEDFPVYYRGAEADNLLAAWTAIWHPALIAAASQAPRWYRADCPPTELSGAVLAVPEVSVTALPSGFLSRAAAEGALLIRAATRPEMLEQAVELYGQHVGSVPDLCEELVRDFLALGYCYLQVQLLTRRMRYASNLDEPQFQRQLLEAAQAAVQQDEVRAREKLSLCYNQLSEERDHYYSVDVYLLDVTLTAPTTLGDDLAQELNTGHRVNLLMRAALVAQLAEQPEVLHTVRSALRSGQACLVGGCLDEGRWPLEDIEAIAKELRSALNLYQQIFDSRPIVFGRWSSGLSPLVPQMLTRCGFVAALHTTFDGNRVPQGSQAKTRWEGADGSAIDAYARSVIDASEPGEFLDLALKLGEIMDMDHVATLCFAHWPSRTCLWYGELRRISRHTPALGKFCRYDEYFRDTYLPGRLDRFEAAQYQTDYLRPAVIRGTSNPISRVATHWQNLALRRAAEAFACWAALLGRPGTIAWPDTGSNEQPTDSSLWRATHQKALEQLLLALSSPAEKHAPRPLLVNPYAASCRQAVRHSVSSGASGATLPRHELVTVPGWGFAQVPHRPAAPRGWFVRKERPVAEQNRLRTERFEAYIHPETGGLLSLRSFTARPNLLSQQLALRLGEPGAPVAPAEQRYTRMVAEQLRILESNPTTGAIETRGSLRDASDQPVAHFRQVWTARRGEPILRLDIELQVLREPRSDPWRSYYACRFAWGDDTALVSRSLHETKHRTEPGRTESPLFIEIDNGHARVAVLTAGLPFHRLSEGRFLDTLLVVRGETQRRFQLGIAVDVAHPIAEAWEFLREVALGEPLRPVEIPLADELLTGWLFRIGVRNVVATSWQALLEDQQAVGFRVALLETAGKATAIRFEAFRPLASATELDLVGRSVGHLPVQDGAVAIQLAPYQWLPFEARFAER